MKYRIAVLMVQRSEAHENFINGLKENLISHLPEKKWFIECYDSRSPDDQAVQSILKNIVKDEYDVIVPVGNIASLAAKQFTIKYDYQIPIIFAGTYDPVGKGLISRNNTLIKHITGVATTAPPETLAIDVLLNEKPSIKSVAVVYRPKACVQGVLKTADTLCTYIRSQNRKVFTVALVESQSISTQLDPLIQRNDGVITPFSSIFPDDVATLAKICTSKGAHLFAHSNGTYPAGHYGYCKDNLYSAGSEVAQYIYKVLIQKISPGNLPPLIIEDLSNLVIDEKVVPIREWQKKILLRQQVTPNKKQATSTQLES